MQKSQKLFSTIWFHQLLWIIVNLPKSFVCNKHSETLKWKYYNICRWIHWILRNELLCSLHDSCLLFIYLEGVPPGSTEATALDYFSFCVVPPDCEWVTNAYNLIKSCGGKPNEELAFFLHFLPSISTLWLCVLNSELKCCRKLHSRQGWDG